MRIAAADGHKQQVLPSIGKDRVGAHVDQCSQALGVRFAYDLVELL